MNYLKMLCKTHLGDKSTQDRSSLYGSNTVLQQSRINEDATDFWAILAFVDTCLDSYILSLVTAYFRCSLLKDMTVKLVEHTCEKGKPIGNFDWHTSLETMCSELLEFNSVSKMRRDLGMIGKCANRDIVYENGLLFIRYAI